jgi:hypothetical protein
VRSAFHVDLCLFHRAFLTPSGSFISMPIFITANMTKGNGYKDAWYIRTNARFGQDYN